MNYKEKLNNLIAEHDLSLSYLCKRLNLSRYKLNLRLKDGDFTINQAKVIDKIERGMNAK
jgi:hypothetical protein